MFKFKHACNDRNILKRLKGQNMKQQRCIERNRHILCCRALKMSSGPPNKQLCQTEITFAKATCIDIRIRVCSVRHWLIISFLCLKDFMYVQFVHKKYFSRDLCNILACEILVCINFRCGLMHSCRTVTSIFLIGISFSYSVLCIVLY